MAFRNTFNWLLKFLPSMMAQEVSKFFKPLGTEHNSGFLFHQANNKSFIEVLRKGLVTVSAK
jgi:hypothetical protein